MSYGYLFDRIKGLEAEIEELKDTNAGLRMALGDIGATRQGVPPLVKSFAQWKDTTKRMVRELFADWKQGPCTYDDDADCCNWELDGCISDCPLHILAEMCGSPTVKLNENGDEFHD